MPERFSSYRFRYPLLLLLAIAAVTIPLLPFAFAYEDVGLNAAKGWLIVEHPGAALWELSWLSSMVAGLWMAMTDDTLLALRVGFLLWAMATALVTYGILRLFYPPRACVAPIFLTYLLSIIALEQLILTYYTVPVLFGLLAIYFWLRGIRESERAIPWGIACGFSFALLIQSRYPSALLGLLFVAGPLLDRWTYRSEAPGRAGALIGGVALGTILGTGLILLALQLGGYLSDMIAGITEVIFAVSSSDEADNIHHPLRMVIDTAIRYAKVLMFGVMVVGVAFAWRALVPVTARWKWWATIGLLLAVALMTFAGNYFGLVTTPIPIGLAIGLFAIVVVLTRHSLAREKAHLYLAAILFFVTMNLGASNYNAGSFKYYLWILLPVAWIESTRLHSKRLSLPIVRGLLAVNIVVAMLVSRLFEIRIPVWELEPFREIPTLEHIRWNHARAFDEMVGELRKAGVREGDTILAYVDMPMLHFATLTIPALRNPWVSDVAVGYPTLERTREIMNDAIARKSTPKVVLRRIYDSTIPVTPKTVYLDSLWGALRYDTVWRDGDYILLKRRE